MKKLCNTITVFFIILIVVGSIYASEFIIDVPNQTITLEAKRVFLKDILKKFHTSNILVKIGPDVNPEIHVNFKNTNLQDAIATLTKGYNHALIYNQEGSGKSKISEIIIFKPGKMQKPKD